MKPETYQIMRTLEDEHWWFVARRRIIEEMIRKLHLPADSDILEIGCGTGGNLAMLGNFGEVTGVELDEAAARMASERRVVPILQGGLPDSLPELNRDFDLVCLFDVIEHIEHDDACLEAVRGLLKPAGRLIVTVPAFPFLWSQHDEENRHFRRYRRAEIVRLVALSGLKLEYATYFNFWLFAPVAAMRLIRKIVPYRESWQDMRMPHDMTNRVLQSIFASERHLLGRLRLPFGVSLLAVISK